MRSSSIKVVQCRHNKKTITLSFQQDVLYKSGCLMRYISILETSLLISQGKSWKLNKNRVIWYFVVIRKCKRSRTLYFVVVAAKCDCFHRGVNVLWHLRRFDSNPTSGSASSDVTWIWHALFILSLSVSHNSLCACHMSRLSTPRPLKEAEPETGQERLVCSSISRSTTTTKHHSKLNF